MSNSKSSSSIGFTSLLLLAFIILKLCKVIQWSWWWVMSPLWISATLAIIVLVAYLYFKVREIKKEEKRPRLKSKWEERLEEMKASKRKAV